MKKIVFSGVLLAALFCMVSCTKSTPTPAANPNPIVGLWVGTFQIGDAASLGSFYYSFNLFSDSTIVQQGGATSGLIYTASGTWSLSKDSAFSATVSNTDLTQGVWVQHLTAKYDSTAGTLSQGVWSFTSGHAPQTGTFSLKRVQ